MKHHLNIIAALWLLVSSCSSPQIMHGQSNPTQSNGNESATVSPPTKVSSEVLNLIAQREMVKLFAWGLDKNAGIKIAGLTEKNLLKVGYFKKTSDGYSADEKAIDYLKEEGHNSLLTKSGALNLNDITTDREAPFKSNIISTGSCQVHFILVWQAVARSLDSSNLVIGPVIEPGLRIVVTKDSEVISNTLIDEMNLSISGVFTRDMTGDGKKEYVLKDDESYEHIQIWRVGDDCTVKKIEFRDKDGQPDDIAARGLWLTRNRANGGYEIHAVYPEAITIKGKLYFEETVSTYRWDKRQTVYQKVKELKRLRKG